MIHDDSGTDEETHGRGHVIDRAHALERHVRVVVVEQLAARGDRRHQLVGDDARLDNIDAHTVATPLLSRVPTQHLDAGLRRAVHGQVAVREVPSARRHADDGTTRRRLRAHRRAACLIVRNVPVRLTSTVERNASTSASAIGPMWKRAAGVREHDVETASGLGCERDRGSDLVLVGDIGDDTGPRCRSRPPRCASLASVRPQMVTAAPSRARARMRSPYRCRCHLR